MTPADDSRRSFLKSAAALAGTAPLVGGLLRAQPKDAAAPLLAYVGTFSSPLRDVPPTQVDLPPGNGRGIHLFRVDRGTGALSAAGVHAMGTSPSRPTHRSGTIVRPSAATADTTTSTAMRAYCPTQICHTRGAPTARDDRNNTVNTIIPFPFAQALIKTLR